MNHLGKPDAGNLPVRFEEGDGDGVGRAISTLLQIALLFGASLRLDPAIRSTAPSSVAYLRQTPSRRSMLKKRMTAYFFGPLPTTCITIDAGMESFAVVP